MTAFDHIDAIAPHVIWPGVVGRSVVSENATFSYLELDPEIEVPSHQHVNEQVGMLIRGAVRFRIGDEEQELRPGSTWSIPANVPHSVVAGPDGAVLVELFAPRRDDWGGQERLEPAAASLFA